MAAGRIVVPAWFPARNRLGRLVPGALLGVYQNGTAATKASIYSDEALTTPLANPVVANSSGHFPDIWAEAGTSADPTRYRVVLSGPDGESIVNPDAFDNWQPSIDAATGQAALAESAATSAQADAAAAAAYLADIRALEGVADASIAIATRAAKTANLSDLSDADAARANIGADLAANVNFTPPGTGAVARNSQEKLRERVSITDFMSAADKAAAVLGTSPPNATAALQAAMTYWLNRFPDSDSFYPGGPGDPTDFYDVDRQTGLIHIPAGVYYLDNEAFSSLDHPRAPFVGFDFEGDGKMSSILLLETNGAEAWFYNNGPGDPSKFQQIHWRNIGFRSDDYRYGNVAKVYSEGGPKQFRWTDCDFQYLQRLHWTEGTGNADLSKVTRCTGHFYGDILTLDNDQSVQHDFIGSDLGTYASFVRVKENGGGNVNVINSSMDLTWHVDFSPAAGCSLYTEETDAAIGQGNCTFSWRDCRIEVEGYTRKATVRAATDTAGYAAGVSTVTLASSGTGAIAVGDTVHFGNDPQPYTVTSGDADVSNGGSITFTPALVRAIDAETTVISTNNPSIALVRTLSHLTATPRIVLENVNFVNGATYTIDGDGEVTGSAFRRIYAVTAYPNRHVHFKNCELLKNFFYAVGGGDRDGAAFGGVIKFSDCGDGVTTELPTGDEARILLHSRGRYLGANGRIITEGMVEHTTGSSSTRYMVDADPGCHMAVSREPATPLKRLYLKHYFNGLPRGPNDDADSFIVLPMLQAVRPGIRDVRIVVHKPADASASADTYQMHVKTTDRSGTTLGSSTSGQFKDEHEIILENVDLSGVTALCLCASGNFDAYALGGTAYIEYV